MSKINDGEPKQLMLREDVKGSRCATSKAKVDEPKHEELWIDSKKSSSTRSSTSKVDPNCKMPIANMEKSQRPQDLDDMKKPGRA